MDVIDEEHMSLFVWMREMSLEDTMASTDLARYSFARSSFGRFVQLLTDQSPQGYKRESVPVGLACTPQCVTSARELDMQNFLAMLAVPS